MKTHIFIRKGGGKDAACIAKFNILLAKETKDKALDNTVVFQGVKTLLDDSNRDQYFIAEK